MSKNSYLVISVNEGGKRYAYARRWHHSNNLVCLFADKTIEYANICDSKKEACETAEAWNESYKKNGYYVFSPRS